MLSLTRLLKPTALNRLPFLLACATLLAVCAGWPSAAAGTPSAPTFPPERPRPSSGSSSDEPAVGRCVPVSSPAALLQEHSVQAGVERGHLKYGLALVPKGGSLRSQLPAWLPQLGAQRPTFAQPSLRVLLCTWLA